MITMPAEGMPELSMEVKRLVVDGVYSLFQIDNDSHSYMLVTGDRSKSYTISESGSVVSVSQPAQNVYPGAAHLVTFKLDNIHSMNFNFS